MRLYGAGIRAARGNVNFKRMDKWRKSKARANWHPPLGRAIIKQFESASWITLAAGFTIGALTNLYPRGSFTVFAILTVTLAMGWVWRIIQYTRRREISGWDEFLRDPSTDAQMIVANSNEHFLVVGSAIEVLPHPSLNTRADAAHLGWSIAELSLNDLQEDFDVKDLIESVGGFREFDPPNGKKYCLVETSFITVDSPTLSIDVRETSYFTLKSVLPAVRESLQLRATYGNLQPSLNRIPHSLCLHYIVRFSDGSILCMKRHPKIAYSPNLWSFSGEEQLSETDFEVPNPGESFFQRTFCEEVLALRDKSASTLNERWEIARAVVADMRLWSVFVEAEIFNFSLLGFYQLSVDREEFVSFHKSLVNRGAGTRDNEGDLFAVSPPMLKNLLFTGACVAEGLFQNKVEALNVEILHPTSRYRIFRMLRAVNRRPLAPQPGTPVSY